MCIRDRLEVVLNQIYFIFDGNYYIQKKGLAMGSPLSGLLADIYLNHYENIHMFSSANKWHNKIVSYTRYVDDTFIIFNGTIRQINNLKNYLNNINKNIQFTLEVEIENKLNFLDLTITTTMVTTIKGTVTINIITTAIITRRITIIGITLTVI